MSTEIFPREGTIEAVADGLASQEFGVIDLILRDAECRGRYIDGFSISCAIQPPDSSP